MKENHEKSLKRKRLKQRIEILETNKRTVQFRYVQMFVCIRVRNRVDLLEFSSDFSKNIDIFKFIGPNREQIKQWNFSKYSENSDEFHFRSSL